MSHPLESILQNALGELKRLVGADTIIGEPIRANERTTVLPVSRVSLGFVSGGGEYGTKNPLVKSGYVLDGGARPYPFTGAVTAGVSAVPVAFLAVTDGEVRVLPAAPDEPLGRVLAALPGLLSEVKDMLRETRREKA
ncbi:MAG: spore germination protein GerW family protein [Clostridia bacterium]|nr:spore germination protein GerW family protein [Clostridia bacterium]